MALTGRFTFRRSLGGKIVLQVEEEVKTFWPASRRKPLKRRWRDANLMDLAAPELRALIDLRYKPQFMAQYEYLAPDQGRPQSPEVSPEGALEELPLPRARLLRPSSTRLRVEQPETAVEVDRPQGHLRSAG
jgi:hypothetical protein